MSRTTERYAYPVVLSTDDDGRVVADFPDLHSLLTGP